MNRQDRRRNRHVPRVCHTCQAPMSSQEDTCWRCGARWQTEDTPETTLRLIPGGADQSTLAPAAPGDVEYPATAAVALPRP
jgi:hypothetical protein